MKIPTINPFNDRSIKKLQLFIVPLLPALIFLLLATNLTPSLNNGPVDLANAAPAQQEKATADSSAKSTPKADATKKKSKSTSAAAQKEGIGQKSGDKAMPEQQPEKTAEQLEEEHKQEIRATQMEMEQKRAEEAKLDRENLARETAAKQKEVAELAQNDTWKDIWATQRGRIDYVIKNAKKISDTFDADTLVLKNILPLEEDARRFILMADNFKKWPTPLEAVSCRLSISLDAIQSIVTSASSGQLQARKNLANINQMAESLNLGANTNKGGEIREYVDKIHKARFLLSAIIARYASAVAPAMGLIEKIQEKRQEIDNHLPQLWKNYYMMGPTQWVSSDEWKKVPRQLKNFGIGLELRRPVELPITSSQWQTAIIRFVITFFSLAILSVLIANALLKDFPECRSHIQKCSMPWNVIGLSLLAASFTSTLVAYRLILAVGNLCLIVGQLFLAWDLRKLDFPQVTEKRSPLWPLVPLTMCAYILLYMPLPKPVVIVVWSLCLIGNLVVRSRRKPADLPGMHIEKNILELEPLVLWPCLIMSLFGLDVASMVAYLIFTSLSIAVQLSTGSISFMSKLNERLPHDGSKSLLASVIIAFSAPAILILAVCAVLLWLGTLPGGVYILQYYIFTNVSVGQSEFNALQLLLIITAFFLARTVTSMGKNFIGKLPDNKSMKIDSSLVTPMQTAFAYLVWGAFGLFMLRSLGMDLDNLAVIAGGLSVGIGFGMQTIVNNFISGLILIFSRALRVGDVVEVAGVTGYIKKITVRATIIETYNSATIYVPNSEFVSGRLTNWTSNSRSVRAEICVGVAYGSDTNKVSHLLVGIAEKDEGVMAAPRPVALFTDFGASTLDFKLIYWVKDYNIVNSTASRIRNAVNARFQEEGIDIAFNQLDVHLSKNDGQQAPQAPKKARTAPPRRIRAPRRPKLAR